MVKQVGGSDSGSVGLEHFKSFAEGEVIFEQGAVGEEMYIVQTGQVEIVHRDGDGTPEERLAVLENGDFFGEMAVLEGEPRTASARALTDCKVLPVSGATFTKMLQGNPEIAVRMMRKMCSRIRHMEARFRSRTGSVARESVSEAPPPAPPPAAAPAAPPPAPTRSHRLIHEPTGTRFELVGADVSVGRPDSAAGTVPEVDLTALNQERTVSRRHARIQIRDGRFYAIEETGTMNGTFVNGQRIEAGRPVEFKPGDEVGFGAVKLRLE